MNETRRKPTTGRQSPSLIDKWHGIFYMPSRIDTGEQTKAFDYPVAERSSYQDLSRRRLYCPLRVNSPLPGVREKSVVSKHVVKCFLEVVHVPV